MLLAIDTSTEMASLALVQDNRLLAELTWYCEQNHTIQLLPRLTALLEKANLNIQSTTAIAVAKGPGSFNGIRVGMSTAKGLAFSLGIPIVGISTLEVEAYPHAAGGLPVCAIHNAGRHEIAAAIFQKKRGCWQQFIGEHITTLNELLAGITARTVFCGEYIPTVADEIKQRLGTKALMPPVASLTRRAFFLAELGQQRIEAGKSDNIATLQPLYLRRPPITERKHK
jgi:tRNA threonylcarbamoyl adenosine modification protein YeaZ